MYFQPKYKDAAAFTVKYRLCLCKAVQLIKTYVSNAIQTATQQVLDSKQSSKEDDKSSNTAFAIYYGKFQAFAPKIKRITSVIEERLDRSNEYEVLLVDLHQVFLTQRANVSFKIVFSTCILDIAIYLFFCRSCAARWTSLCAT